MKRLICISLTCLSIFLITLGCSESEQEEKQPFITQTTETVQTEHKTEPVTELTTKPQTEKATTVNKPTFETEARKKSGTEKQAPNFFIYNYPEYNCPDKLSYKEAKERFGHPIVECKSPDFVGYYVSYAKGEIRPEQCYWVTYKFKNGEIKLIDDSRVVGTISYEQYKKHKYNGDTFYYDDNYDNNTVYYSFRENMILTGRFSDKETDDVCALMKSLVF